jgi:hypothetical protein
VIQISRAEAELVLEAYDGLLISRSEPYRNGFLDMVDYEYGFYFRCVSTYPRGSAEFEQYMAGDAAAREVL